MRPETGYLVRGLGVGGRTLAGGVYVTIHMPMSTEDSSMPTMRPKTDCPVHGFRAGLSDKRIAMNFK